MRKFSHYFSLVVHLCRSLSLGVSHHVPPSIPHRQMVGYGCSSLQGLPLRSGFTSATARSRAGFRVTPHDRGRLGQWGLPEGNLAPV